jgi:hypothetical protein
MRSVQISLPAEQAGPEGGTHGAAVGGRARGRAARAGAPGARRAAAAGGGHGRGDRTLQQPGAAQRAGAYAGGAKLAGRLDSFGASIGALAAQYTALVILVAPASAPRIVVTGDRKQPLPIGSHEGVRGVRVFSERPRRADAPSPHRRVQDRPARRKWARGPCSRTGRSPTACRQ